MSKVPYPYEVKVKLVTGNGSLLPICSLSNRSLLPSLTVLPKIPLNIYLAHLPNRLKYLPEQFY